MSARSSKESCYESGSYEGSVLRDGDIVSGLLAVVEVSCVAENSGCAYECVVSGVLCARAAVAVVVYGVVSEKDEEVHVWITCRVK